MMTLEEAIIHCENVAEANDGMTDDLHAECHKCAEEYRQLAEWLKELKQLREQEPCEDTISRQIISDYVESHIQEINTGYGDLNKHTNEILRMIVDYIESMPPVTPQPKTGRWIKQALLIKPFGEDTVLCDQCAFMTDKDSKYKYCPNCGAKMQEEEE